jgi:hypothetical protein
MRKVALDLGARKTAYCEVQELHLCHPLLEPATELFEVGRVRRRRRLLHSTR